MKNYYALISWGGGVPVLLSLAVAVAAVLAPGVLQAAESRSIEEITVTAERKVSSVQDTSISITAFTAEMLDDFGIRNQSDLQNMIPATTIQPYDSAIRGVGRNFRNLGGDPGIATYMNNIYSEDLYTATIGSFWDIERIEVLRGPQGTLYGRNAVGGAMNFLYKKPSDELEFSAKTILGSYGTRDLYAVISGPLIADILSTRLTVSSRNHDGWVREEGPVGDDLDSGNEDNVSVQVKWNITDAMTLHIRQNRADVDRVFGGGDGGGLVVFTGENTVPGGDGLRNYTILANGLRAVSADETNPLSSRFIDSTQPILSYINPTTGATIQGQRIRPGVDRSPGSGRFNHGLGVTNPTSQCVFSDRGNIRGRDLCAFSNGFNNETFDQKGTQLEFSWDISDSLTFKYLFGYNDLLYQRVTDSDNTAGQIHDRQFYVNHEATYSSHEFQLFWDVGDNLSFTSGVFFYDAVIDQRYDFYSSTGAGQFTDPAFASDSVLSTLDALGAPLPPPSVLPRVPLTFLAGAAPIDINSAKEAAIAAGAAEGAFTFVTGSYALGDATLGSVPHGPATLGTDLLETNRTEREAFAVYTQGVWDINDKFTLTFGLRYARDELDGEENAAQYAESVLAATGDLILGFLPLGQVNILRGAIDATTLQPTGLVQPWLNGVPITFGAYRNLSREDDDVTWRLNLDYNISDDSLIYINATTGYRSGGFNLAFFSQTPTYEPEALIAYEIGYKSQFLDNTLQLNGSVYLYDYESIHTRTEEACPAALTAQSMASACLVSESTTSVQAAGGAEVRGLELEVLWLATDALTIGGNFSYTDTEYTESFIVVDGADPTIPSAIYDATTEFQRVRDLKGKSLPRIPDTKLNLYASYNIPLGNAGSIDLLGSYSYIDDVYFTAFESPLDLAPAYARIDLRATWSSPSEEWVVSAFVNNLADEIGIRQIALSATADGYRRSGQVTEPRVYGLELSYTLR